MAARGRSLKPAHLETIYRNGVQTAYMAGYMWAFEETKDAFPFLMYDAINDSRTRPHHLALDGVIKPVGDAFWRKNPIPGGHRCRCSARSLSAAEARARGGVTQNVPAEGGADEGWGGDPREWGDVLGRLAKQRIDRLQAVNPVLAQATRVALDNEKMRDTFIRDGLASASFAAFFAGAADAPPRFPVAHLTPDDRALFGSKSDTLWLSRHSLDAHIAKHPEVTIDDYMSIPDLIRSGEVWSGHSDRRYVLLWIGGRPYRAAIKVDAAGEEAWFLSLVISGKQKPPKGAVRLR